MEPLMTTVTEAAKATGLSRSTVYELMRSGSLASVKVGARRLIPTAELARFVANLSESQR